MWANRRRAPHPNIHIYVQICVYSTLVLCIYYLFISHTQFIDIFRCVFMWSICGTGRNWVRCRRFCRYQTSLTKRDSYQFSGPNARPSYISKNVGNVYIPYLLGHLQRGTGGNWITINVSTMYILMSIYVYMSSIYGRSTCVDNKGLVFC